MPSKTNNEATPEETMSAKIETNPKRNVKKPLQSSPHVADQRIHRKNLQEVGGIPLIQRTIEAAKKSKYISRIIVSTDDDEIGECALRSSAIVIRRPKILSNDTAKSEDALLHAIKEVQKEKNIEEKIAFLQCTSPFITAEDIDLVIAALDLKNVNSSFAATPWHGFLWSPDGQGINHNPFEARVRRQDLEVALLETGSIYAMRTKEFLIMKTRFCQPTKPVIVAHNPKEIDTQEDLEFAESCMLKS